MAMPTVDGVREFLDSHVDSEDFNPARAALILIDAACEVIEQAGLEADMTPAELKVFKAVNAACNGLSV